MEKKKLKQTTSQNSTYQLVRLTMFFIILIIMIILLWSSYRVMNRGGVKKEISNILPPISINKANHAYFDEIEMVRTATADESATSVSVQVQFIFNEKKYKKLREELIQRKPQIADTLRSYFTEKTADELTPEFEDDFKKELKGQINTLLRNGMIDNIIFPDFRVLPF